MAGKDHNSVSVLGLLQRLWGHLSDRRRFQFKLVLVLMVASAFMEVISLGAVIPFLGVLVAPEKIFQYSIAQKTATFFSISQPHELVLPLTLIFIAAALFGAGLRLLLLWASSRVVYSTGSDISYEIYRRTLFQPYLTHLSRNTSEVSSGLNYKVVYTVGAMYQTLVLITSIVLVSIILLVLVVSKSALPFILALGFGGCYFGISLFFKRKLKKNSELISSESTQVVRAVQEGLGGIRDVLLDGTQDFYCEIYRKADIPLQHAIGNNIFIGGSPRFLMEAIGMLLVAGLAYVLSQSEGGVAAAFPILGAIAMGAQRLLPSLQQSYASWVGIVSNQAALRETLDFLDQPLVGEDFSNVAPLDFKKEIQFDAVKFRYSATTPLVLDGISLTIPKGARVGITGGTGSGKSTMLDLLMGLVEPAEGVIKIDNQVLKGAVKKSWQKIIAHVPQVIYLTDASLAENIAFGIPKDKIDMARVRSAAKRARIDHFAESSPQGYETSVGERGVKLSGGQRQRIGIARALYKDATVLMFDEATSALDNNTEKEVMDAIDSLDSDLTVIIVAHRLTTIKKCDIVIEVSQGKIVGLGSYEHLLKNSESFRKMVNVHS